MTESSPRPVSLKLIPLIATLSRLPRQFVDSMAIFNFLPLLGYNVVVWIG